MNVTGACTNDRDDSPGSGDCPPGSLTLTSSISTKKGRPKRSSLIRFYSNLRRKAIVDPLALLALALAALPLLQSLWWTFYPAKLTIGINPFITVKSDSYQLHDRSMQDIIRLTASFTFENHHAHSKIAVESISAKAFVGNAKSEQFWAHFIHSHEKENDHNKLHINYLGNVTKIVIDPKNTIEREIYFAPLPSSSSNPLDFAITTKDFIEKINAGTQPCVEFIVIFKESGSRHFFFVPINADRLQQNLSVKGWTVSEWTEAHTCG